MTTATDPRIEVLKVALDEEVHGLWISTDMAVKVLAAIDAIQKKHLTAVVAGDSRISLHLPAKE